MIFLEKVGIVSKKEKIVFWVLILLSLASSGTSILVSAIVLAAILFFCSILNSIVFWAHKDFKQISKFVIFSSLIYPPLALFLMGIPLMSWEYTTGGIIDEINVVYDTHGPITLVSMIGFLPELLARKVFGASEFGLFLAIPLAIAIGGVFGLFVGIFWEFIKKGEK